MITISGADEWDETMPGCTGKGIDLSFLCDMEGDLCMAEYTDGWGRRHECLRLPGHTGRHLATDRLCRYPVAVWR